MNDLNHSADSDKADEEAHSAHPQYPPYPADRTSALDTAFASLLFNIETGGIDVVIVENHHEHMAASQSRHRIAELFNQLQGSRAFSGIYEPVAWQKTIRQDRPLPGRAPVGAK